MSCEHIRQQLSLYVYGELSFDEEEAVESHLDGCAACRTAMESERHLHNLMDQRQWEPSPQLLMAARRELDSRTLAVNALRRRGGLIGRMRRWVGEWNLTTAVLKPAGALATLASYVTLKSNASAG